MRIIPPAGFKTMPWKNGGGVTHEILKAERNGKLLWRLSIADVASDGPFSLFPGLLRILTVIEGDGLVLSAPDRELRALPLRPLAFSGNWPITARRLGGNVRDFNVIYDAAAVRVEAAVHPPRKPLRVTADGALQFILVLGDASADGQAVAPGSLLAAENEAAEIACAGPCLRLTLHEH